MATSFSQEGFTFSFALHAGVLVALAGWMWMKPHLRPRETVFEVIQIPLGVSDGAMTAASTPPPSFNLPDAPAVQPISPPRPQPQPQPQPQAAPPRTTPAPPVQRQAPAPVPRETVAPPQAKQKQRPAPEAKQLTYEEFVKQHGQPKTRPPRESTRTPAPRSAPRIDTRFNVDLTDAIRSAGSAAGTAGVTPTAVNVYVAGLNDLLKQAWNNPQLALTTVVEFDVAPSGRFSNVRVVKRSGNAAFDESVLAAFREVSSGGPTPEGRSLQLRFNFNGISP